MSSNEDDSLDAVAALIGFVLAAPFIIWEGFVLSKLWTWFVVPLGVPPLGVAHAAGISLVVGMVTSHAAGKRSPGDVLLRMTIAPLLALVIGAIIRAFM